jgi:hypothetical protein
MELVRRDYIRFSDGSLLELKPYQYAEMMVVFKAFLEYNRLPTTGMPKCEEP